MDLEAFDWTSPDADLDAPPDTLDFYYSIEFSVREAGKEASTNYQVIVCSPSMTSEARAQDDLFIVQKAFDLSALKAEVSKRLRDVARSRPSNWERALSKYYHWEHHDPRFPPD